MRSSPGLPPVLACRLAVVLSLSVVMTGCASTERPPDTAPSPPSPDTTARLPDADDDVIRGTGTIRYVDLEGGFYGLVAEDGTKYDPTPLPDSLRVDGLSVRFRVRATGGMTTRMWGTPVELVDVERIETGDD
jgi:hypothetical protein